MSRNTVHESYRLGSKQTDWSLPGTASIPITSRTRGGGHGRPNFCKRVHDESSTDSDFVVCSSSSSESDSEEDADEEEDEEVLEEDGVKPSCTRIIVEHESLRKCMEKNCRCLVCNGPVMMEVNTLCLASNVMLRCKDDDCGWIEHSDPPAVAKIGVSTDERQKTTGYAINALYVLGFISCGDGCSEGARLLGLLGLPNDTTMASRSFGTIEERMSPIIQSVTSQILLENLMEEVRLTFEGIPGKDETDFDNWRKSLDTNNLPILSTSKYPAISVSYDMGWQQRSSGRRYASPSGHAFFVGGLSRKPVSLEVKSKICNFCSNWKKKHPEDSLIPLHSCTMNHEGSSSSMEAAAALTMIVDLFDRLHVSIATICIDDDASTPSQLKWSNADYMNNKNTTEPPLVPITVGKNKGKLHTRPDNGKLLSHIPEPLFVADPNHRKKVFTKDLRTLLAQKSSDRHSMSGMDVLRLGKNFGYMIRDLKRQPEDRWEGCAMSVLEHHFDNHTFCGAWCPRKRLTEAQRHASERFYRNKEKDAKLYGVLQHLLSRFITMDKLRDVSHVMDTQVNESLNNTISWLAPKNKCYGGSQSLQNRIVIAVGINSLGLHKYFTRVFAALGITMTPNVVR
jgi:hypothetical protein